MATLSRVPREPKASTTQYGGAAKVHVYNEAEMYAWDYKFIRKISAREQDVARVIMTPRPTH